MGGRKKKRSRFEYGGAYYHWFFDENNWRIRIYSEDKKFVIAYFIGDPWQEGAHLEVHGEIFPGLTKSEPRPVRLCIPIIVHEEWSKSLGALVNALLSWSLDPDHSLERYPPSACINV